MTAKSLRRCTHAGTELPECFPSRRCRGKGQPPRLSSSLVPLLLLVSAQEPLVHSARTAW